MTFSVYCPKLVCFIRRSKYRDNVSFYQTFTQFFFKIICNSLKINEIFF